jgi:hypothetical protein
MERAIVAGEVHDKSAYLRGVFDRSELWTYP